MASDSRNLHTDTCNVNILLKYSCIRDFPEPYNSDFYTLLCSCDCAATNFPIGCITLFVAKQSWKVRTIACIDRP